MYDHHAHLLVGAHDVCFEQVPYVHRTGADADVLITEQLTIGEVRLLIERAWSRPIEGDYRYFVLSCQNIHHEAQNALLKLFEDPPDTVRFYLIVPRMSALLPTLKSRLSLFFSAERANGIENENVTVFLRASYSARLDQIAALHKRKDTAAMRALIENIERVTPSFGVGGKRDLLMTSMYSNTRGASNKMLLEHLALSLPQSV